MQPDFIHASPPCRVYTKLREVKAATKIAPDIDINWLIRQLKLAVAGSIIRQLKPAAAGSMIRQLKPTAPELMV